MSINTGTISEILVFNVSHTTSERQAVESYLAAKWNTANFPGTPTYSPMVQPSAIPIAEPTPTPLPTTVVSR